ncbi:hypothetical protein PAMC26577_32810 [Caballeronia sordidicola]|uniref:Uncharacterized protein n=1 Tax=Caballeronia sordidicola TaxID=196367 RepID=A0A242MBP7_CABSO|nr:hypothetical protein PAMC26577_32810 [Caballeronia sordidicola]
MHDPKEIFRMDVARRILVQGLIRALFTRPSAKRGGAED